MKWLDKLRRAIGPGDKTADPVEVITDENATESSRVDLPDAKASAGIHEISTLSPRELQVFHRLLEGAKLRDIAAEIGVQTSTVAGYSREVYKKLGVNSKVQLILRYGEYRVGDKEVR